MSDLEESMRRVFAVFACLAICAGVPAQPAGAPPGTYNASPSTSGAFTGSDVLYAGNPGFFSRELPTGGKIISYKKITVTTRSMFWGVTGNAAISDGDLGDFEWQFTVDPTDGALATANPLVGSIANEALSISNSIDRGNGFFGTSSQNYDLLLNPLDGVGFLLEPGEYYITTWVTRPVSTFELLWSELSTSGIPTDIFYHSSWHAPGEYDVIKGLITLGGFEMLSGDLAMDVWMVPVVCDGDANGDSVVDVNDISYVLFRLGDPCAAPNCDGDANGDGTVDVNDISYVLFRLGDPC